MRILITGASGFIGGHLVEYLGRKHQVAGLYLPGEVPTDHLPVKVFHGDITRPETLTQACRWPELVIHGAGLTKARFPREYFRINTDGVGNLVGELSKVNRRMERFIFLSTVAAAGPARDSLHPLKEDDESRPRESYGKSKLFGEKLLSDLPFPSTTLRLPFVYGGGSSEFLIYVRLAALRIKLDWQIPGSAFSVIYIDDLVKCIDRLIDARHEADSLYYLSDGRSYTLSKVSATITGLFPRPHLHIRMSKALFYAFGSLVDFVTKIFRKPAVLNRERVRILALPFVCSSEKFENFVGNGEMTELEEGSRQSIQWYRREGWM